MPARLIFKDFLESISDRDIEYVSGEYKNIRSELLFRCKNCGNLYYSNVNIIKYQGCGCRKCGSLRTGEKTSNKISYVLSVLERKNISLLSEKYINNKKHITVKCNKCGNVWEARFNDIQQNRGCRICGYKRISGSNHWMWKNDKLYGNEWTEELKEKIRNRDNRKCQFPDCYCIDKNVRERNSVHHVDGNKKNCSEWNLINLCRKHHLLVERYDFRVWIPYFTFKIEENSQRNYSYAQTNKA